MAGKDALRDWLSADAGEVAGTPIENMMYRALRFYQCAHVAADCKSFPIIIPQDHVGPYRVDFTVEGAGARVAVECDGHDFHERTKEQAAKDKSRDRFLAEQGYTVLRFTGSEIWANPFSCAHQVMRMAAGVDMGDTP